MGGEEEAVPHWARFCNSLLALKAGSEDFSAGKALDLHKSRGLDWTCGEGYEYGDSAPLGSRLCWNRGWAGAMGLSRGLFVLISSQGASPFGWLRDMVAILISSGKSGVAALLFPISLFRRSRSSCMSVSFGWDFGSGLISGSLLLDTLDPDGSGFHLFIRDSVSLSREDVEIEEEEEDVEGALVETAETTVEDGGKVVIEGWAGENVAGVEEYTVVEEERVKVEEAEEEEKEVLGPDSCILALFLMERSMGEQLE